MMLSDKLRLCLICDSEATRKTVEASVGPSIPLSSFSLEGLFEPVGNTSERFQDLIETAASADAVLVEWDMYQAPFIGTISYRLRSMPPPLIALCQSSQEDQAAALVVGADHTLRLPFSVSLLKAQIIAYTRSMRHSLMPAVPEPLREFPAVGQASEVKAESAPRAVSSRVGPLALDRKGYRFYVQGQEVKLTPRQFALIEFLMSNVDTIVTRDQILEQVWGIHFDVSTNMVDVYVHFIRRLLKTHGLTPSIETVCGKGYRFVKPERMNPS